MPPTGKTLILAAIALFPAIAHADPPPPSPAGGGGGSAPTLLPCIPEDSAPAESLPSAEAITAARKALEQLDYERAMALVRGIGPEAPPALRTQALEIGATAQLILGRAAIAQPLLEELYFLAPAFLLDDPSLPPRVTKMFEEEAARPHTRAVKLELRPTDDDLRGYWLLAAGATAAVDVACRPGAAGVFLPVQTFFSAGRARFRLPSEGGFQCFALARDRDGLPLGRLGTAAAPMLLTSRRPAPPPPPTPVWQRWYFWTGIGAVVVGGAVVAAVVATRKQEIPAADITVDAPRAQAATIWRW